MDRKGPGCVDHGPQIGAKYCEEVSEIVSGTLAIIPIVGYMTDEQVCFPIANAVTRLQGA